MKIEANQVGLCGKGNGCLLSAHSGEKRFGRLRSSNSAVDIVAEKIQEFPIVILSDPVAERYITPSQELRALLKEAEVPS